MIPPVRFAGDDVRIAYQAWGEGAEAVLAVPPLAQNIELAWESPEIAGMLRRFGSFCRYAHFDKRGTGASDPADGVADLDERIDDMRLVLDAAGFDRAHLYGVSDGGPMAVLFAATYPERVCSLVLDSTAACLAPELPSTDDGSRRAMWDLFVAGWGTEASITMEIFGPSLLEVERFRAWWPRYERQAASPSALRDLLAMNALADVRPLLDDIDVPTLVLHHTGDRAVPLENAEELAAGIDGARLVTFEGGDHWSFAGDIDPWMDEIERWVTGTTTGVRAAPERSGAATAGSPGPGSPDTPATNETAITTLGRFAVERDGVEVPVREWGSRRARQLCKRLVVASGQAVPRDELIELLWPEDPEPERLGARLSVVLSIVRRVLGRGIEADRDAVRLDPSEVRLDLAALRDARSAGDDATVVALYDGAFLPEDAYEDWTAATRNECRHAFVTSAARLLDGAGEPAERLALADRALDVDPHLDKAHRARVRSLAAQGERAAALTAYERYRAALAELGVAPESFEALLGP
ncbi:MAG: alpha/beta fold hydrolase [Actinomycetota bacterium]|nr:alpha/beta fold hydrolase [Actinomycetota bacterium]